MPLPLMAIAALASAAASAYGSKKQADAASIPDSGGVGGGSGGGGESAYTPTQGKDFLSPGTSTPVGSSAPISRGFDKSTEPMVQSIAPNAAFASGAQAPTGSSIAAGMKQFLPPNAGNAPLSLSQYHENSLAPGTVQQPAPPGVGASPDAGILEDPTKMGGTWSPMQDGSFLQPGSTGDMGNLMPEFSMPESAPINVPGGGMSGLGMAKPPAGAGYGGRGAFNMPITTPRLGELMAGQRRY
ncbi:MAG: hypothetical protein ACYS7Y_32620 [Planctomycetota bacterium]